MSWPLAVLLRFRSFFRLPPPLFLCCQAHPQFLEAHLSFRMEDSFQTTSLSSSGRCRSLFRARPLSLQSTPFLPESLIPTRVTP